MDLARGHVAAIRKLGNMQGQITCNLGPELVAKALASMKPLVSLFSASFQALLRLFSGSIRPLFRLFSGSFQALFRLY
jgi:hypothetical protein